MKRLVLVCLFALAFAGPVAARPSMAGIPAVHPVSSWLSRAWKGLLSRIGGFRLFDGDGTSHTLPPPSSVSFFIGG